MDPFCQITIHFFSLRTLTVHQCLLHLHLIHRSLIVISLMPQNLTLRIIVLLYIIVFLVCPPIVVDFCDPHCTEHCDLLDEYALWFVQCLLDCALLWILLQNSGGISAVLRVGMMAHRH